MISALERTRTRQRARARRVRARIRGTAERPRLSVFRSHRHITAQLIDDEAGRTVAAASDGGRTSVKSKSKLAPTERAARVGEELAKAAKAKGIGYARFDRGRYRYHGVVRALATGARKGGLQF